jgi:Ca-activated chloride channel family protein
VLLLVDSSAAMASELGVRTRMEHVTSVVSDAVDYLDGSTVEIGLRAYGILPRSRQDCRDSTMLVPLRRPDRRALSRALSSLRPSGKSPIAYSLEAAGGDLQTNGENTIVMITGGPDDCSGDPCAVATQLLRSGAATRIYVLGLGIGFEEGTALDCIGDYHAVTSAVELKSVLRGIFRAVRRGEAGTVNVFEPDGGRWVASAFLRERLELNPGTYDIQIISDGETYLWEKVKISGTVEVEAAPRPPRRLR